jgi:outer membrane immunogenic protein
MLPEEVLRPLALGCGAALCAVHLAPWAVPASAQPNDQQHGAPSCYGTPYAPPPNMAGARSRRRPLDQSYRAPPGYMPPHAMPGIWEGLYIGAHGGDAAGSDTPRNTSEAVDLSGASAGLHAGYNWQARQWVLGLEGDAAWSNLDGGRRLVGPVDAMAQYDWTASIRARLGIAVDNVLLYATGGIAFGGFHATVSDGAGVSRAGERLVGCVIGGGLEWKRNPNLSLRFEGLHYRFDDRRHDFGSGNIQVDSNVTTVRAGITFHLN